MNKIYWLLCFVCIAVSNVTAQVVSNDTYSLSWGGTHDDNNKVLVVARKSYMIGAIPKRDPLISQIVNERKGIPQSNGYFTDTSSAVILLKNFPVEEISKYEYRVLKNGKEVVTDWATVEVSNERISGLDTRSMILLGKFKSERESFLQIDVREKSSQELVAYAMLYWFNVSPQLYNIYFPNELKAFLKKMDELMPKKLDSSERSKWTERYKPEQLDSVSGLPKKLLLEPAENNLIFFIKQKIFGADVLEYRLIKNGKLYIDWKKNDFDKSFIYLNDLPEGDYILEMRFTVQPENVTSYPFEIKPRWDQTAAFKIIAGGLIAAFFGFIIMLVKSGRQKKQLKQARFRKMKAESELRSIHARLNPHFVFNALNSIQGLINTSQTAKASEYLAGFSKLLRGSLEQADKDTVTLEEEIKAMETYIRLEQLRFRFQYSIEKDESFDASSVEFPGMLLQPLIENAIRHGVSSRQERGLVKLRFIRKQDDLVISVTDNGQGMPKDSPVNGYGLKLTRQRIQWLNDNDEDRPVEMHINDAEEGTSIELVFKNRL